MFQPTLSAWRTLLLVSFALLGTVTLARAQAGGTQTRPRSKPETAPDSKPESKPEDRSENKSENKEGALDGRYRAEGTNPDGKPYRSIVDIEQNGDTYMVRWLEREGPPAALGIGIVRGEYLSVSYLAGRALGVVVYHIEKGPVLTGQWTVLGSGGLLWPETLSRVGVAAERRDAPGVPGPPPGGDTPGVATDVAELGHHGTQTAAVLAALSLSLPELR